MGGLVGGVLIYAWAYRLEGIASPTGMLKRFFVLESGRVFFGVGLGKALNLPIGMIRNIFPVLGNYVGIRDLLSGPKLSLAFFLLLLVLCSGFLVFCFAQVYLRWSFYRLPRGLDSSPQPSGLHSRSFHSSSGNRTMTNCGFNRSRVLRTYLQLH